MLLPEVINMKVYLCTRSDDWTKLVQSYRQKISSALDFVLKN